MVEPDYVIALIGNDTVGKTSIVNRLKYGTYQPHYLYTQGADQVRIPHFKIENDVFSLLIYDTGGHHIQRRIIREFIEQADAIVIVYDISNWKSFRNVPEWIELAASIRGGQDENKNPQSDIDITSTETDHVLMILGNKTDLGTTNTRWTDKGNPQRANRGHRAVTKQKMEELARIKGISLHEEVSAKLNTNIDLAFKLLVETLKKTKKPRGQNQQKSKTDHRFCTLL